MEALFGSLDFCECDHCRSVLSPAAYLVDILKFTDPDDVNWQQEVSSWAADHGGVPYPFSNADEWEVVRQAGPGLALQGANRAPTRSAGHCR